MEISKHFILATSGDTNFLSDKVLYEALSRYKLALDTDPVQMEVEEILKDYTFDGPEEEEEF